MIRSKYILIILVFAFMACEKVIDVDLNDAAPEIVIEANLSNSTELGEVLISKTGSYFGESSVEEISDALVTMEDESGNVYLLDEVESGYYRTFEIVPEENTNYKLSVNVEGEKYEASSTLNTAVKIDSIYYYYDDGFAFIEGGYSVKLLFVDPVGQKNFYRIKVYQNDTLFNAANEIVLFDDRLIDGQELEVSLQGFIFDLGDTIAIQLISLDEGAYEYYKTFQELTNVNPGSAAPANPTSNISNSALGYFSAWSADVKWVVIEELE